MKIYEIGTGYTPIPAQRGAATEIVVEELAKAFLKLGQDVQVVDIAAENRAPTDIPIRQVPVPRWFRRTDVKLGLMHKLKRVVYSMSLGAVLGKMLRKEKEPVVLHFHNQYNLFFFLLLTGRRLRQKAFVAYTNHSGIWRQNWPDIENIIRRRYFQEAYCMCRADLVFLLNSETRENVVRHLGVPEDKTVLIGNGVNTDVYHPLAPSEIQTAKKAWGLSGYKMILQVGSINENKGQLRTAEGLLPLLKKHPDLVFACAGAVVEESCGNRLMALAREQDMTRQIRYLGEVAPGKALNELYNVAEATILPSRFESFGLAAVESMAAGVPVLLEEKSLVTFSDGVVWFGEGSLAHTAEQLLYAEPDDYENLCVRARTYAQEQYSWEKTAGSYLRAFRNGMKQE